MPAAVLDVDGEQLTVDGQPATVPSHRQVEVARFFAKVVADPRPGGPSAWTVVTVDKPHRPWSEGHPSVTTRRDHPGAAVDPG
jgi:hypothetical protein